MTERDQLPGDQSFEQELDREGIRPQTDEGDIPPRDGQQNWGFAGLDPTAAGQSGWTKGRIIAVATVAIVAGFWVWAFSPLAPRGHPDALDDLSFATEAKALCVVAEQTIDDLPRARTVTTTLERAELIDSGTVVYRSLIDELNAIAPPPGNRDGDLIEEWLGDWEVYLGDRQVYADKFRVGIDEAFTVTVKNGDQITDPIDNFASANGMAECSSPQDV